MPTAKYIPTDLWNDIISRLIKDKWIVSYEYDGIDAGIDYNQIKLEKDGEELDFEWTNWEEGEIKSVTLERLREIEMMVGRNFGSVEG